MYSPVCNEIRFPRSSEGTIVTSKAFMASIETNRRRELVGIERKFLLYDMYLGCILRSGALTEAEENESLKLSGVSTACLHFITCWNKLDFCVLANGHELHLKEFFFVCILVCLTRSLL